jgi:hypothetical protein
MFNSLTLYFALQLAKYCDTLLKKTSKVVSESDLDEKLQQCITVFKYLDDKDIFQRVCTAVIDKDKEKKIGITGL